MHKTLVPSASSDLFLFLLQLSVSPFFYTRRLLIFFRSSFIRRSCRKREAGREHRYSRLENGGRRRKSRLGRVTGAPKAKAERRLLGKFQLSIEAFRRRSTQSRSPLRSHPLGRLSLPSQNQPLIREI